MTTEFNMVFAEDDDEDWMLLEEALDQCPNVKWVRVKNGEDLLAYIRATPSLPHMVLLDLRMPRKDGFWAMKEIRKDPHLAHIPITIMTTSKAETDVVRSYAIGANAYMVKPPSFEDMKALLANAYTFWTRVARIPGAEKIAS